MHTLSIIKISRAENTTLADDDITLLPFRNYELNYANHIQIYNNESKYEITRLFKIWLLIMKENDGFKKHMETKLLNNFKSHY